MEHQETEITENKPETYTLTDIPLLNLILAMLIAPISGFLIVLFITSLIGVVSRELWSLQILWPPLLFVGGVVGGIIGAIMVCGEIWLVKDEKMEIIEPQIISPDLFYIGGLALIVYILEILSESIFLQGILFILEIGWFSILCWNLSKSVLEEYFTKKEEQVIDMEPNAQT